MPHFYVGDELGALKSVSFALGDYPTEWKATTTVLVPGSSSGRSKTVQKLALHQAPDSTTLVMALPFTCEIPHTHPVCSSIVNCSARRWLWCSACDSRKFSLFGGA